MLQSPNLASTLVQFRQRSVRCLAAHPHTQQNLLSRANLAGNCCIVFGNKFHGISPEVIEVRDEAMAIPMPPGVDSLNFSAAAAVFLYQASRRRGRF